MEYSDYLFYLLFLFLATVGLVQNLSEIFVRVTTEDETKYTFDLMSIIRSVMVFVLITTAIRTGESSYLVAAMLLYRNGLFEKYSVSLLAGRGKQKK